MQMRSAQHANRQNQVETVRVGTQTAWFWSLRQGQGLPLEEAGLLEEEAAVRAGGLSAHASRGRD